MNEPINLATDAGAAAVDDLREACLAVQAAVDRAAHLSDPTNPLHRQGLGAWQSALEHAWTALTEVYAGLGQARRLHGVRPATVAGVLDGLAAAGRDAQRAADAVAEVRRRLAVAEDRLRRDDATPAARAAAGRWRAASARLDLVAARLAIGARTTERYAEALAGQPADPTRRPASTAWPPNAGPPNPEPPDPGPPNARNTRAAHPLSATQAPVAETVAGARAAGRAVLAVRPWGGWRGFWARVLHEIREDHRRRERPLWTVLNR